MLVTPESEGLGPRGWNIYALPPLEGWKTPFCTVRDARTDIFLFRILDPPRGSREFYLLLHLSSKYFYSRNRRCFLLHFQGISSISVSVKGISYPLCVIERNWPSSCVRSNHDRDRETGVSSSNRSRRSVPPLPKGIRFHVESKWWNGQDSDRGKWIRRSVACKPEDLSIRIAAPMDTCCVAKDSFSFALSRLVEWVFV